LIDLHCHILPGIDDGAVDMDDALAMARQAESDGIEIVCATPHIRYDHDVRIHELDNHIAALQAAIDTAGIRLRIVRGGEVAEPILGSLTDDELATVALGGGRWILLEPRPGPIDDELLQGIDVLAERGFGAIIAHPERHIGPDIEARLRDVVARGALVQATAARLAEGDEGTAWLTFLAHDRLIHVLGSDAHRSDIGRRVELSAAYAQLEAAGADAAAMKAQAESILADRRPGT
jgi:protein-tyrosine phosphatase